MKSVFKKETFRLKKIFLFASILFSVSEYSIAQEDYADVGPYTYDPPQGTQRYNSSLAVFFNGIDINMSSLNPLDQYDDCLMLSGIFLINNDEDRPLIAFVYDNKTILEIRYSEKTVTIRRYNNYLPDCPYYDYHLFDPLLDKNSTGDVYSNMRFYFTSNFMYITADNDAGLNYMSPVYFGLDIPSYMDVMSQFLTRNNKAVVKVGDTTSQVDYISNIDIYSLSYSKNPDKEENFWWILQSEFASPNPPMPNN
jgi:hypothetical protein